MRGERVLLGQLHCYLMSQRRLDTSSLDPSAARLRKTWRRSRRIARAEKIIKFSGIAAK